MGHGLDGGNGDAADGDLVKTGPFAFDPADPNAWTLSDDTGADTGAGLQRAFGVSAATLPTQAQVDTVQALTPTTPRPGPSAAAAIAIRTKAGPASAAAPHPTCTTACTGSVARCCRAPRQTTRCFSSITVLSTSCGPIGGRRTRARRSCLDRQRAPTSTATA